MTTGVISSGFCDGGKCVTRIDYRLLLQVEVLVASMGTSLSSVGGFCVGHHEVCDHQRLCGQGYCFSASLPPYLATAAHEALSVLGSSRGQQLAQQVGMLLSLAVLFNHYYHGRCLNYRHLVLITITHRKSNTIKRQQTLSTSSAYMFLAKWPGACVDSGSFR